MKNFFLLIPIVLATNFTGCVIPYYNFGYGYYSAYGPYPYYQYPYYEGYCDNYLTFYPSYYYRNCPNHFYNYSRDWPASFNFSYFSEAHCNYFSAPYVCR